MKITFVLPVLDLSGGCRVVSVYAQLLQERGHEVTVVVPRTRPRDFRGVVKDLLRNRKLFVHLPSVKSSHFNGSTVNIRFISWTKAVEGTGFPDADLLIGTWWETMEWVDVAPRQSGAKAYFIQHHEVFEYLPIERVHATYSMKAGRITIAKWIAEVLRDNYKAECVAIVRNAVDHAIFTSALRQKQLRPTLGFVYSPISFKGAELAISAIERVKSASGGLRVIAFGSELPSTPLPGYIEFHYRPAQSLIPDLYRSCDVWVCPSHSEGFNLPAMEAMACGTPVVSTSTGWPAEAIEDGVNGYLVNTGDVNAMTSAIQQVLAMHTDEWRKMSSAAQATAHAETWEKSVSLFEKSLRQIVLDSP